MRPWLSELNEQQQSAVKHGDGPLLIVAGAGTGKTKTLACRVSYLISQGVAPERILLLTFTRRAAEEMLRRASAISSIEERVAKRVWGGTFHSVANRLLRTYAEPAGLNPGFSIMDRSDSEDMLDVIRNELSLSTKESRFPRKGTCLDIYSHRVNGVGDLDTVLKASFPWCAIWKEDLLRLFRAYAERKLERNVLDYDDLLLYWYHFLEIDAMARLVGNRFDHILVDEYQDTNPIQAGILKRMRQFNHNITVVGDDAQSIYSFRSATVRNMLDFPKQFPGTTVVTLEQNYRSRQSLLVTTNVLIGQSRERYAKELWSERDGGRKPQLITCRDENEQDEAVIKRVLEHYEQGIPLRKQAVLFRAASHSATLELALVRHNIPFHKYGGLRFLETAHVKDLISFVRIAENPRDEIAWFRVLRLLQGVGPVIAANAFRHLSTHLFNVGSLTDFGAPQSVRQQLAGLAALLAGVQGGGLSVSAQIERIAAFYSPLLRNSYDDAGPRLKDIEHLQALAARYRSRREFLDEMVLDPPVSTGDLAGPPFKDDDWLVLSTIHSAKGLEWDAVYLIHAADGFLPSDMATGTPEEIEEELRLTYVAMTRARDFLYVLWPLRYYSKSAGISDRHSYAQCCRFFTPSVLATMECLTISPPEKTDAACGPTGRVDVRSRLLDMWQ